MNLLPPSWLVVAGKSALYHNSFSCGVDHEDSTIEWIEGDSPNFFFSGQTLSSKPKSFPAEAMTHPSIQWVGNLASYLHWPCLFRLLGKGKLASIRRTLLDREARRLQVAMTVQMNAGNEQFALATHVRCL